MSHGSLHQFVGKRNTGDIPIGFWVFFFSAALSA